MIERSDFDPQWDQLTDPVKLLDLITYDNDLLNVTWNSYCPHYVSFSDFTNCSKKLLELKEKYKKFLSHTRMPVDINSKCSDDVKKSCAFFFSKRYTGYFKYTDEQYYYGSIIKKVYLTIVDVVRLQREFIIMVILAERDYRLHLKNKKYSNEQKQDAKNYLDRVKMNMDYLIPAIIEAHYLKTLYYKEETTLARVDKYVVNVMKKYLKYMRKYIVILNNYRKILNKEIEKAVENAENFKPQDNFKDEMNRLQEMNRILTVDLRKYPETCPSSIYELIRREHEEKVKLEKELTATDDDLSSSMMESPMRSRTNSFNIIKNATLPKFKTIFNKIGQSIGHRRRLNTFDKLEYERIRKMENYDRLSSGSSNFILNESSTDSLESDSSDDDDDATDNDADKNGNNKEEDENEENEKKIFKKLNSDDKNKKKIKKRIKKKNKILKYIMKAEILNDKKAENKKTKKSGGSSENKKDECDKNEKLKSEVMMSEEEVIKFWDKADKNCENTIDKVKYKSEIINEKESTIISDPNNDKSKIYLDYNLAMKLDDEKNSEDKNNKIKYGILCSYDDSDTSSILYESSSLSSDDEEIDDDKNNFKIRRKLFKNKNRKKLVSSKNSNIDEYVLMESRPMEIEPKSILITGKESSEKKSVSFDCVNELYFDDRRYLYRDKPDLYSFEKLYENIYSGLVGLGSLNNTCYLNSTIQCLSNIQEFRKFFFITKERNKFKKNSLAGELAEVFEQLWHGSSNKFVPENFVKKFKDTCQEFNNDQQHDAHEFFVKLLNSLHGELKKKKNCENIVDSPDEGSLSNTETSIITDLFTGVWESTTECKNSECQYKSSNYEAFNSLTVPIDGTESDTLPKCIKKFMKYGKIHDWICPNCKQTDGMKQFNFTTLPNVLVIHVNRFIRKEDGFIKNEDSLIYPVSEMKINKYSRDNENDNDDDDVFNDSNENKITYDLIGVIVHSGTVEFGHYTSYCKNPQTETWYSFDDERVTSVTAHDVSKNTQGAYIFFYEKKIF